MAVVLGADGCPGNGWVVAALDGPALTWHHVVGAAALLDLADRLSAVAVAVDVPIGLPEDGVRRCDVEARAHLAGRASSVFAAPPRRVLRHPTYALARPDAPSLSAQSFALVSRIRDVDDVLRAAGPSVHERVVECHPEVSFRALAGRSLPRKKSAPGALARLAAVSGVFGELPLDAPVSAGLDDALDALACAWTAGRVARGEAVVLGGEVDATGVPMRIVV
jgi:predicted RNase H-like nuclease